MQTKYPDLSCEIEKFQFDKDAQDASRDYLKIEQDDKNIKIIQKYYCPYKKTESERVYNAEIIGFDENLKIVKLLKEKNFIDWFDFENKTFWIEHLTKYFYFKINTFEFDKSTLNFLSKLFDISLSSYLTDSYIFDFIEEPQILNNVSFLNSKQVNEYLIEMRYIKNSNYHELRMYLKTPISAMFEVEVGVNFHSFNQGYIKLFCMNNFNEIILDKIKDLFTKNQNFEII